LITYPNGVSLSSGPNVVPAGADDIVLFRPVSLDNYSAGTLSIYAPANNIADPITGFTLVEQQTTIGDRTVNVGDILYGTTNSNDVHHYDAALQTSSILVDGDDLGLGGGNGFSAIELIETPTTVAGVTFDAGQLLLSNVASQTNNGVTIGAEDVYRFDATSTGAGNTVGAVDLVFDGSDVANLIGTGSVDSLNSATYPPKQ